MLPFKVDEDVELGGLLVRWLGLGSGYSVVKRIHGIENDSV